MIFLLKKGKIINFLAFCWCVLKVAIAEWREIRKTKMWKIRKTKEKEFGSNIQTGTFWIGAVQCCRLVCVVSSLDIET